MDELIRLFHSQGKSNRKIGLELGIHHKAIAGHLKRLGLIGNVAGPKKLNIVSEGIAKCSKCNYDYPIESFQFVRNNGGRISYCNKCRKQQGYERLNQSNITFLRDCYTRIKARAKRFNIIFDISYEDFIGQYNNQLGKCFYSGKDMLLIAGSGKFDNSLSVDKIVPEIGYVKGNIVFCINKINTCKNNISLEQMKEWMPGWHSKVMEFYN